MDPLNNELATLEAQVNAANMVLDGTIVDIENSEETLSEFYEEEKVMREALRIHLEKIHDKKTNLRQLKENKVANERQLSVVETKFNQQRDKINKESNKAESYQRMTAHAKAKNFEWVDKALEHQWSGALALAHYGSALLNDTMGLGKTMTSIMYLDMVDCGHKELGAKKTLFLVPNDVVMPFADEIKRWAPHRAVLPISGGTARTRELAKMISDVTDDFIFVANYESTWRDISWLSDTEWDVVGVDEAHAMKNTEGVTYSRVLGLNKKHVLPITATFILNQPQDLFASLSLILPDVFGRYDTLRENESAYLNTYCTTGHDNKWVFKPGGEKALMNSLGGRVIRRTMEDANIELPKQHVNQLIIPMSDMTEKQYEVYNQITNYAEIMTDENGDSIGIESVIALITRQRQAATYPAGITIKVTPSMFKGYAEMGMECAPVGTILFQVPDDVQSVKVTRGADRLEYIVGKGRRGVVFSQFKTALKGLEAECKKRGLRVIRYDGDTSKDIRNEIKRDFKRKAEGSDYKWDVVLCNYKTGGVGLTLTAATYVLQLDEEWNPGKNDQALARVHRIGQTEETMVEIMRIDNEYNDNGKIKTPSIDMWLSELNELKSSIIGGFEDELDTVDIKESFQRFIGAFKEPEAIEEKKELPPVDDSLYDFLDAM